MLVVFLFVFLVYKNFQSCVKFSQKCLIIYNGLFYLLEYLFIYLINNYYIYFYLICKYNIKENYDLNNVYIINEIGSNSLNWYKNDIELINIKCTDMKRYGRYQIFYLYYKVKLI